MGLFLLTICPCRHNTYHACSQKCTWQLISNTCTCRMEARLFVYSIWYSPSSMDFQLCIHNNYCEPTTRIPTHSFHFLFFSMLYNKYTSPTAFASSSCFLFCRYCSSVEGVKGVPFLSFLLFSGRCEGIYSFEYNMHVYKKYLLDERGSP